MKNEIAVVREDYPLLNRNKRGSEKANLLEWVIIANIDPFMENHGGSLEIDIPLSNFFRWGIATESNLARDMKSVFDELTSLKLTINSDEKKGEFLIAFPRLSYDSIKNSVKVEVHASAVGMFIDLRRRFTQIDLNILIDSLGDFWARKIYIVLRNELKSLDFIKSEIEISKLRSVLGVVDYYERWDNFKDKILDVAIDEINRNSDIAVKYKTNRRSRESINSITFSISKNEKKQPRLPMPIREAFQISDAIVDFANRIGFNDLEHMNFLAKEIGNEKLEKANKLFEKRHANTSNEFKASVYRKRILQIVIEMETPKKEVKASPKTEMPPEKPKRDRTQEVDDYIVSHRAELEAAVNPSGTWKPEVVEKLMRLEALARLDNPED
jgi:plasmid replication initiation protein